MEQAFWWWHQSGEWLAYCLDTNRDPDALD
jgi:hypothetical protein